MAETAGPLLTQGLTSTLPGSTLRPAHTASRPLAKPKASSRSPRTGSPKVLLLYRAGQSKENIKKLGSHLELGRGSSKWELLCHERTTKEVGQLSEPQDVCWWRLQRAAASDFHHFQKDHVSGSAGQTHPPSAVPLALTLAPRDALWANPRHAPLPH